MTNLEKYNQAYIEAFDIDESTLNKQLLYQSIAEWDSVGHMQLMAILEDSFEIALDMDDIIDFSSYAKGKEILKKYEIKF